MRPSVILSNSRISRSSSTTSTVCLLMLSPVCPDSLAARVPRRLRHCHVAAHGASRFQAHRRSYGGGQRDAETTAAARDRHVFEAGLVGVAHLLGEVQAEARAVLVGREEWLENLCGDLGRDAGAAVDHFQQWWPSIAGEPRDHHYPRGFVR